jgi:hypothetical protein
MGYRSEVVLAVDAKIVPALMTAFAKCEATQKLCTQECDELNTDYDGDGNWFMRWDGIKWYESYPEIAMLTRFIEAMNCDDLSEFGMKENGEALSDEQHATLESFYSFVRIGEDSDDVEMMGHAFESIGIHRSINY